MNGGQATEVTDIAKEAEPDPIPRGRAWVLPALVWLALVIGLGAIALWPADLPARYSTTALHLGDGLLSAQVILLVVLLMFGLAFRQEVGSFLDRTVEVAMPGASLRATQRESKPGPALPALANQEARRQDEEQRRNLVESLASSNRFLRHWYLSYLSVFLAPVTQSVLRWFEQLDNPISVEQYHNAMAKTLPDANGRALVLNTLVQYDLIRLSGQILSFTDSGRALLSFLDGQWRPLEQDTPPARERPARSPGAGRPR